jgi:peptide-methionine (S)-S-oxide reductase
LVKPFAAAIGYSVVITGMKTKFNILCSLLVFCISGSSCGQKKSQATTMDTEKVSSKTELATFGAGCFWCTEAVFQNVNGVVKVESGYTGGKVKNPTYEQICTGMTGHAEVIQLTYDPAVVTFPELLEIFWKTHDPTTLNKQGADEGTQYRSVIFYHTPEQKKLAEEYKGKLDKAGAFDKPIVTEISPANDFYKAEAYHQNYYNLNGNAPYCTFVIQPKLEKFKKAFADKLKK